MEKLIHQLREVITDSHEHVSMIIKDIDQSSDIFRHNGDTRIISASTIKVAILLAVLHDVKQDKIRLEDELLVCQADILSDSKVFEHGEIRCTLYELLHWMIIESDNTATNVLIKAFTFDKINAYIKDQLQCSATSLQRYMLDSEAVKNGFNNYTSQAEMCHIFTKLFHKELLTPELCEIAIEILHRQRYQDLALRYVYEPVRYAHKTGNLEHYNHDVGVMSICDKHYYVGISVYDSPNKKGNKPLMGTLGKLAYEYLKQK